VRPPRSGPWQLVTPRRGADFGDRRVDCGRGHLSDESFARAGVHYELRVSVGRATCKKARHWRRAKSREENAARVAATASYINSSGHSVAIHTQPAVHAGVVSVLELEPRPGVLKFAEALNIQQRKAQEPRNVKIALFLYLFDGLAQ